MRRPGRPGRPRSAALLTAVTLLLALVGAQGTARAASTAEQNINIVSTHSGMCLEVATAAEGEVVAQRRCAGRKNALWTLKSSPLGGGSYQIVNVYSGKCMAVENSSPSAGALVRQQTCGNQPGASLTFTETDGGVWLQPKTVTTTPQCLEVTESSTADGARLRQWGCDRQPGSVFTQERFQGPPLGWAKIRPASAPSLCVTEGRDRKGLYASAVAVQRACAQAVPPRTYLEEAGTGRYRIQWHHPEFGIGCLTVMNGGPVPGMLEPWDACASASVFLVEPAETPAPGGFRIREAATGQCLGMVGGATAEGVEVMREPCTSTLAQEFFIDPQ
ncbi:MULTISPECIES: RICIN domain-containing protein [Streptomyces]|uniref:RICIN domain-containing protein n=1 Tax=Streptomyces TaxID=1883 RepID=UPI001E532D37|nr:MULTISPECIES: RICIN domain-containing protein [Streptomyces]UFQ19666.1 RICIN domain-containing protein [Streptomyces huasconensis]WCL89285.1 RICIN domain-containing protein [Streptomyces sp. JCM 35825]